MLQIYAAVRVLQHMRVCPVWNLRRFFDQFKNACRTCECILQLRNYPGYFVKGLCILVGIAQKTGELPDAQIAVYYR